MRPIGVQAHNDGHHIPPKRTPRTQPLHDLTGKATAPTMLMTVNDQITPQPLCVERTDRVIRPGRDEAGVDIETEPWLSTMGASSLWRTSSASGLCVESPTFRSILRSGAQI